MCKVCGALVGDTDAVTVRMGGRPRTVCHRCKHKRVPMMDETPGREIRSRKIAVRTIQQPEVKA